MRFPQLSPVLCPLKLSLTAPLPDDGFWRRCLITAASEEDGAVDASHGVSVSTVWPSFTHR
jgi:hypothetical protein